MDDAIMDEFYRTLERTGYRFLLQTYSALDRYYGLKKSSACFFLTDAPLSLFARLFENMEYFKTADSDVLVQEGQIQYYFQCVDSLAQTPRRSFSVLNLYYDPDDDRYIDTCGMYGELRSRTLKKTFGANPVEQAQKDAALLAARYQFHIPEEVWPEINEGGALSLREQRLLLYLLLCSDSPDKGLAFLHETGFIARSWPELTGMAGIPQTKDHHPEGNVWNHILEAFKYRKKNDPLLSFAILLHDLGKTVAVGTREKPFQDHAHHGAYLAERFLKRLSFPPEFTRDVLFLVRCHMMPEALPRMPLYRIEKLMNSELFPTLLELYRADLLSTFQGPEKYYAACGIYRTYMKTRANPFRTLKPNRRIVG